jgi:hypothetical protein
MPSLIQSAILGYTVNIVSVHLKVADWLGCERGAFSVAQVVDFVADDAPDSIWKGGGDFNLRCARIQ